MGDVRDLTFCPFKLDAELDVLSRATKLLPLGGRAAVLLRALIERPGAPVSKDTLIEVAWSGGAVEDSNLTVQIAALRRALGEEPGGESWIETLPEGAIGSSDRPSPNWRPGQPQR